jgi:hypothetical protein
MDNTNNFHFPMDNGNHVQSPMDDGDKFKEPRIETMIHGNFPF